MGDNNIDSQFVRSARLPARIGSRILLLVVYPYGILRYFLCPQQYSGTAIELKEGCVAFGEGSVAPNES